MASKAKCTINDIKEYFLSKDNTPCPLTEKLVKAGYQQRNGGYIERAIREGVEVDYTRNKPSQYWHLMTYCNSRNGNQVFSRSIVCGEQIFWMAEVSGCIPMNRFEDLVNRIISDAIPQKNSRPLFDRKRWNKEIQKLCFDAILSEVARRESPGSGQLIR